MGNERGELWDLCTRSIAQTHYGTWWRHQMETFSALLVLCVGNSSVTGEFPSQRPVTRSFDVSFHLRLNRWLSKQSRRWWFETPSHAWWRHYNDKWWRRPLMWKHSLSCRRHGIRMHSTLPVTDGFPSQRPEMHAFDASVIISLNIQPNCWWFETPCRLSL